MSLRQNPDRRFLRRDCACIVLPSLPRSRVFRFQRIKIGFDHAFIFPRNPVPLQGTGRLLPGGLQRIAVFGRRLALFRNAGNEYLVQEFARDGVLFDICMAITSIMAKYSRSTQASKSFYRRPVIPGNETACPMPEQGKGPCRR